MRKATLILLLIVILFTASARAAKSLVRVRRAHTHHHTAQTCHYHERKASCPVPAKMQHSKLNKSTVNETPPNTALIIAFIPQVSPAPDNISLSVSLPLLLAPFCTAFLS